MFIDVAILFGLACGVGRCYRVFVARGVHCEKSVLCWGLTTNSTCERWIEYNENSISCRSRWRWKVFIRVKVLNFDRMGSSWDRSIFQRRSTSQRRNNRAPSPRRMG